MPKYIVQVQYDTVGWLDKNRDRLPKEVAELMASSQQPIVAAAGEQEVLRDRKSNNGSRHSSASRATLSRNLSSKDRKSLVRERGSLVGAKLNTLGFKVSTAY